MFYNLLKEELENLYTKFKDCKYKNRNCISLNRINHPRVLERKDFYLKNVLFLIVKYTNSETNTVSYTMFFRWDNNRSTFMGFEFDEKHRIQPTEDDVEYIRQLIRQVDVFNETCDYVYTISEQIKEYCEEKEVELPFALNVFQSVLDGKDNDY